MDKAATVGGCSVSMLSSIAVQSGSGLYYERIGFVSTHPKVHSNIVYSGECARRIILVLCSTITESLTVAI